VERELVLRLASLLWRMRRAISIETDLLGIQAGILRDLGHMSRPPGEEVDPGGSTSCEIPLTRRNKQMPCTNDASVSMAGRSLTP
jgi:hypothetical protein